MCQRKQCSWLLVSQSDRTDCFCHLRSVLDHGVCIFSEPSFSIADHFSDCTTCSKSKQLLMLLRTIPCLGLCRIWEADSENFPRWLKNTIHSIVAGIYGSWFFCAGKPGGMPTVSLLFEVTLSSCVPQSEL